jgi:hypothetical protein
MSSARRICDHLHTASLGLWLGALGMSGAAAAIVFPTMKDLDPKLAAYAGYEGSHTMLAGGHIAWRVFMVGDIVQYACVLVAGVTFGIAVMWLGLSVKRVSTFVRALLLLGLVGVLAFRFGVLQPGWDHDQKTYWDAAKAGNTAAAEQAQALLHDSHPVQERFMAITAGLVLAALGMAVFTGREGDR